MNGFGPNFFIAVEVIFTFLYIRPKTFHLQLQSCCTAQSVWAQIPNRAVLSQCLCYMAPSLARRWSLNWKCFNSNRCPGEEVCVCVRERQKERGERATHQIMLPSQLGTDKRPLTFSVWRFLHFLPTPAFLFLEKINTHYKKHTSFHICPNLEKHIVVCVVGLSDFNQLYAILLIRTILNRNQRYIYPKFLSFLTFCHFWS